MKRLLKYLVFLMAAVAVSSGLCVGAAKAIALATRQSFVPRLASIAEVAALITGEVYFIAACVWAGVRKIKGREAPMDVAMPAFVTAVTVVVGGMVVLALLDVIYRICC